MGEAPEGNVVLTVLGRVSTETASSDHRGVVCLRGSTVCVASLVIFWVCMYARSRVCACVSVCVCVLVCWIECEYEYVCVYVCVCVCWIECECVCVCDWSDLLSP